jgi:hypothetical protein
VIAVGDVPVRRVSARIADFRSVRFSAASGNEVLVDLD